jgi:hypothetical protein
MNKLGRTELYNFQLFEHWKISLSNEQLKEKVS